MRATFRIVILAIVALFTTSLRAPSLPTLDLGQDAEEQISSYRSPAQPALSPVRHGRSLEASRQIPLLAVLPSCPRLTPALSFCCALPPLFDRLHTLLALPRSSRGPPVLT
jgi:hypothetical protein